MSDFSPITNSYAFPVKVQAGDKVRVQILRDSAQLCLFETEIETVPVGGGKMVGSVTVYEE